MSNRTENLTEITLQLGEVIEENVYDILCLSENEGLLIMHIFIPRDIDVNFSANIRYRQLLDNDWLLMLHHLVQH